MPQFSYLIISALILLFTQARSLNREPITRALISKLSQLILSHSSILLVNVACLSSFVLSSIPPPHEPIDHSTKRNHAERHSVTLDVSRSVRSGTVVMVRRSPLIIRYRHSLDERRHDACRIAPCQLHACTRGALSITR